MPSESKPLLITQTEKPNHYSYLKEFRVDQCPLFLQHKCTQHRPYTCFHWHFMNQRRRRPVRKRDGTFNYCADSYCTKFDETTGICPDGDDCPFLHRTAGDTERRYHLRYYKTCVCVHDTDARGFCVKNGPHCAFAHGSHDLRPPVYDIKEILALENPDADANAALNGPNVLDKERGLMNEDPKWQDSAYVLANYKTEPCKRPPRLCRQGYACPQYHNSRDKRRNPKKIKYRSTPCPNVKHGDEWGEPSNCESGDACAYCHTRTEQQFHPEIYKSTKCNDVQQAGYCPRGYFCAFAHLDQEMSVHRDTDSGTTTNLADILSNVLPPDCSRKDDQKSDSSNGSGEVSESGSICSVGSNKSSKAKAPGAEKSNANKNNSLSNQLQNNQHELFQNNLLTSQPILGLENHLLGHLDKPLKNNFLITNGILDPFESFIGSMMDEDARSLIERDMESPVISNTLTAGLLGSSAPVNIPGSTLTDRNSLTNFSPPVSSPLNHIGYLGGTSRFHDATSNGQSQLDTKLGSFQNASIYDFGQKTSPHHNPYHPSALLNNFNTRSSSPSSSEVQRLHSEIVTLKQCIGSLTQESMQNRSRIETLRRDLEDKTRTISATEKQRDEALSQAQTLQKELESLQKSPFLHGLRRINELKTLPIAALKSLQAQLRSDLEVIDKVIYQQTATLCMVCEENVRSVTLDCNHFVICNQCVSTQKECPYCQTPLVEAI